MIIIQEIIQIDTIVGRPEDIEAIIIVIKSVFCNGIILGGGIIKIDAKVALGNIIGLEGIMG